jgi:L-histidine N-alpha-methyltransferase
MKGFESERHERELWQYLQENVVPLKFAFAGEAARKHDAFAKSDDYEDNITPVETELELINRHSEILHECTQVCDIGPGNGLHTKLLLDRVSAINTAAIEYLAVDFSQTLLQIATNRISEAFPKLTIETATWDIERSPTDVLEKWRSKGPLLLLFLGSTLCNPSAPSEVLENIYASATQGDLLLVELAVHQNDSTGDIPNEYQSESFRESVLEPLRMGGINTDRGHLDMRVSPADQAVYGYFVFDDSCVIKYQNSVLRFTEGDSIRCFQSHRFSDSEIRGMFRQSGWEFISVEQSEDESHSVYLYRRK